MKPEIRRHIITEASPEKAYDAWTEPEHLSRWFCDSVTGWPGYGSKLKMTWAKFGYSIEYSLPIIQPPRKVVLKSLVPGMGTQTLDVSIRTYGSGSRIEVVETGPGAEGQEGAGDAKSGWEMSLAVLKLYLEKYFGRNRQTFSSQLQAVIYQNEQLMNYYQSAAGLSQWLTVQGAVGAPGDPVSLLLKDNNHPEAPPLQLTGQVLAVTKHELAISWNEIEGFLEFKSFEVNAERKAIYIRGTSYGTDAAKIKAIEELIDSATKILADMLRKQNGEAAPPA